MPSSAPVCPTCERPYPAGADGVCPSCSPTDAVGRYSGALDLSGAVSDSMAETHAPPRKKDVFGVASGDTLGRYQILAEIGRGGMGQVYLALDPKLGRRVALKVIRAGSDHPELRSRFLREARAMARLKHPDILAVHDIEEHAGQVYFTMDYVEGTDLSRKIAQGFERTAALRLLARVCRAVQAAHEAGIIHRDLKPSNILVDGDNNPRVMDFGLARLADDDAPVLSRTGALLGTPGYMAPEQIDATAWGPVDERTDVWALGVILYEILGRRRPFEGQEFDLFKAIVSHDPIPPVLLVQGLPRDLDTIALCALEKSKERRYPTAAAVAEDIERFLAGLPIRARPLSRAERFARWIRRRRLAVGIAALLALASAGAYLASIRVDEAASEAAASTREEGAAVRTREREEEVARKIVELESRMDWSLDDPPSLDALDALRASLDRLEVADKSRRDPWLHQLDIATARAVAIADMRARFAATRELLRRYDGDPEAARWRLRIDWLELPERFREWPGPYGSLPPTDDEGRTILDLAHDLAAVSVTSRDPWASLSRARLLLHVGRAMESTGALRPLREHVAAWSRSEPQHSLVFDLYHGLVLSAPDLEAAQDWYREARTIWDAAPPDPVIENRGLIVPVAHAAAAPYWRRWLDKGDAKDLARALAWVDDVYEASNLADWKRDEFACELPWIVGVGRAANLATDPDASVRKRILDALADAVGAGYEPINERRYRDIPLLWEFEAFRAWMESAK